MSEVQRNIEPNSNQKVENISGLLEKVSNNPESKKALIDNIRKQIGGDEKFKSSLEDLLKKDPTNKKLKELYDLFYSQAELKKQGGIEKKESVKNSQEISNLENFFGIKSGDLQKLENSESMKELGFSTLESLKKYQNYIEKELKLSSNSEVSSSDYNNMILNIKLIITKKLFDSLGNLDQYKNDKGKLENMQWIVNSNSKDNLSDVSALLITGKFYLLMKEKDNKQYSSKIDEKSNGIKNERMKMDFKSGVKGVILDFETSIVKGGNVTEVPKGIIGNKSLIQKTSETYYTNEDFLLDQKIDGDRTLRQQKKELGEINFLNEEDKKIEEKAMYYYLGGICLQMTPYAGLLPSLVVSAEDIVSSYDATLEWIKRLGLVPNKYKFEKSFIYNILGIPSTVASAVGLNEIKGVKAISFMNKIPNFSFDKLATSLGQIFQKLNIDQNMVSKVILYIRNGENLTDIGDLSKVNPLPVQDNVN